MHNANSFLVDWSIGFMENKDFIKKRIKSIKKTKDEFDFIINYKDKIKYFILKTYLYEDLFNKIKSNEHFGVITLNNLSNIDFVVRNWKKLTDFRYLSIYFINPFSNLDKAWTLFPHVHEKICDKTSLEKGLKSMSEMIEPIEYNELGQKLRSKREESDL